MTQDYIEPTGEGKAGWRRDGDGIAYAKRYASPWETFLKEEGVPVFKGIGVRDSRDLPRGDWARTGGSPDGWPADRRARARRRTPP